MKLAAALLVGLAGAALAVGGCGGQGSSAAVAVEWGYSGPGAPENWASLSEEYAACAEGRRQSPVDIVGYRAGAAGPLSFAYGSAAPSVRRDAAFTHVEYAPGNVFTDGQRSFQLKSAHLHAPSEHRIDGLSFAAEMHLVHEDDEGGLAVVGLMYNLGAPNPVVQAVLDAAPEPGGSVAGGNALAAVSYVPDEGGYYRYEGSKTTPPCSEPVVWYVMKEALTVSPEQVDGLQALSGGPTNRPLQPLNGRGITVYSSAAPCSGKFRLGSGSPHTCGGCCCRLGPVG